MTNEQREAIDKLRERFEPDKFGGICALGYKNKYCFGKSDLQAIDTVLSLIKEQQEEMEKKDKQIDLMAEYISKRDVEEDICMKNKTNPDWCNEDYTNCQDCIKKYFADLVEKESRRC